MSSHKYRHMLIKTEQLFGEMQIYEKYSLDNCRDRCIFGLEKCRTSCWKEKYDFVHRKMMDVFRLYLIVGGMPDAVNAYKENNNLQDVMAKQQEIIRLYRKDISQYDEARIEKYRDEFLWLKDAGVAIPTYNVEEPKSPLKLASSRNLFKLFSNDVGLLACQYSDGIQLKVLKGDVRECSGTRTACSRV